VTDGPPGSRTLLIGEKTPAAPPPTPGVDLEVARRIWGDHHESFLKFLRLFAVKYEATAREVNDRLAEGDLASAGRICHRLAGSAGTVALPEVARLAKGVERLCAERRDPGPLATELEGALRAALAAIELIAPAPDGAQGSE
jgi:HPt (histidine-containing phosphotransfer) domain-containing protein